MELTLTLRNTAHMTRNFLKLRPGLTLWLLQMHWVNGDLVERDKQRLTCTWVQIPAKCRFGTSLGTISCAVRGFPIVQSIHILKIDLYYESQTASLHSSWRSRNSHDQGLKYITRVAFLII